MRGRQDCWGLVTDSRASGSVRDRSPGSKVESKRQTLEPVVFAAIEVRMRSPPLRALYLKGLQVGEVLEICKRENESRCTFKCFEESTEFYRHSWSDWRAFRRVRAREPPPSHYPHASVRLRRRRPSLTIRIIMYRALSPSLASRPGIGALVSGKPRRRR